MITLAKIKFRTFGESLQVHSNPGCRDKITYSPVYDKSGSWHLEESGKVDFYSEIQSHADSVDIHVLLARYAAGDESALMQRNGEFFDATDMPRTYAEFLNLRIEAEKNFYALPADVRAKFDHSLEKYMVQAGTPEWLSALGIDAKPAAEAAAADQPDVKEVEKDA